MQEFLNYGFSGLTTAAIFAIAASGLVLTYTTTGVFNFAHGAMAMVAAFSYWEMRFGWNWPAPLALAVCLLVLGPVFGALLELVIMRRLEGTSDTTKLVVTLSVLLALLGLALWVWDPNKARPMRRFWEGSVVTIANVRLPYHQVACLVIGVLVAIGLRLLLYRTRVGVAMRACVDDRSLAMLNGARPTNVAMLSWAVGSALAALAGVLIAPTLQLSALPLTLLVIDAYAAAIIGRLRSLPMTVVGALILGLANDYGIGYVTRINRGSQYITGLIAALPVIILFIVLLLLPQSRLRGHRALRTREVANMPTWPGALAFAGVVVAGTLMVSEVVAKADLFNLTRVWGIGIIALSMIPLVGYAGQISLCQLTFGGIGMVVVAHLGAHGNPLAYVWAAVIAGAVGAVVALPALRLSGIYLALSTGAFAVLMDRWIFQLPAFTIFGHKFDLFQAGSLTVNSPKFLGLNVSGAKAFFVFGSVLFGLFSLVVVAIRKSDYGQRLLALKDSPAACATLGLNPTFTRLSVFAVSAAIAGVGGAVYGGALHAVDAQTLDFFTGLAILMLMVIGGVTTLGGALFTGMFLGAPVIANVFPSLRQLSTVVVGVAGIGLGKNPNGFIVNDIRPRWNVFLKEREVLGGVIVALVGAWVLRMVHVLDSWPYAIVTIVILAVAPEIGRLVHARRTAQAAAAEPVATERPAAIPPELEEGEALPSLIPELDAVGAATVAQRLSGPLEWLGVTQPFRDEDVELIDRVLAVPELRYGRSNGAP